LIFSHARLRLGALLIVLAVLAPLPAAVSAAESAAPAATEAVEFPVGPYLLADAETGEVFEHSDAMRPWFPASTTKLMTIYVAFRAVLAGELNFDSAVLYSENAAAQPASKMGFKPGTTLTLDNAIKMMMVKSANDIAVAVAEAVGGSVEGFSARMNAEAARLGMTRSHFVNPHGLPDERQVTTARDMALLTRALLTEFPQHRDYYKLHAIRLGKVVMKNYNTLIERYPGANGMKTGFICASGYNLVASARRGEREIIAVVFGEYGGRARAEHAAKLLDEGFAMAGSTSPETVTTLANVSSGTNYTAPLDMRPFVCAANRAAAASEANSEGGEEEDVSHLSAPIYHGPPIRVTVGVPAANAETITTAAAARLPRPRPTMPGDPPGLDANAFAPEGGPSAPIDAIDSATGAAAPLSDAPAN
jgi:D-alanyl-D-alanine carboxypeptidase